MSNIVKNDMDLQILNDYLKRMKPNKIDKDLLIDILKFIIPKENNEMIKYKMIDSRYGIGAQFVPEYRSIIINLRKISTWLESNYKDISNSYNIDNEMLKNYLLLYVLLHEVEHSYQYLIGHNIIDSYDIVKYIYKESMNLLIKKEYIIPRPITLIVRQIKIFKYYKNQQNYVLERNANVNSFSDILSLAIMNEQNDISKIFLDLGKANLLIGYLDDNMGCLYNTYKDFGKLKQYNKYDISNIKYSDRLIYGLKINEQEHKELIKKYMPKK